MLLLIFKNNKKCQRLASDYDVITPLVLPSDYDVITPIVLPSTQIIQNQ